ncbi:PREDICTED: olfactory receptor 6B2-like [Thamnophis sirtalis]|uniref:Olfactory receptor n=1 Tax=Thamnophis sirtalis TaxID=35019 RepID=A0A6I9YFN0_9SAUR|nr:PREDICTED: olfactory receptor 6B2-like [Thamnophis sirtalis]
MDEGVKIMMNGNKTVVTYFIILGFPSLKNFQFLLFFVGLFIYVLTLSGHLTIISIVYIDRHLHIPMYFFLSSFSFLEIWYTSNIIPQMLEGFLTKKKSITYTSCVAQLYFFISFGTAECFILVIMAFDRYLAICNPLRYQNIMNNKICHRMVACSWIGAFLINIPPLMEVCKLPFCGPNEINHFFCDVSPLLKLSCVNPDEAELCNFIVATSVIVSSFSLILVSYILIIVSILKIPSSTGRQKAFSTCGSHLAVVTIFYGTLMFMYVRPTSKTSQSSVKLVSVFYTVVTPLLNPIIYCLRNREVKDALRRAVLRKHGLTMKPSCFAYWKNCSIDDTVSFVLHLSIAHLQENTHV